MARAVLRQILFGCAATGFLVGCVDSGSGTGSGATGSGATGAGAGLLSAPGRSGAAREVEFPDAFQTTDTALWDGRPSLGGIWVASPDVKDPERVVMVNAATGKSVTGALFRRESGNPGPKLQLSSDAAEALGVLAGQPVQLRVTALRKVEVAALDTAEAGTAAGGTAGTAAAPEAPKRKTWAERRAEAKARREAEKAALAAAAKPPASVPAGSEAAPTAASVGVAAIETAPLDARSAVVAAGTTPAPEPKKTRRQIKAEEQAADAAAAATAAAPEPAPAVTGRPIQVASFSKEENAARAVEALAKIGVSARPVRSERGGKAVWGVVAIGDAELLKKIKAVGFADAYFLN